MNDYEVKYTDSTIPPIEVPETEVNDTAVDVPLHGRINLEYGESLNESLLNLVENFSCPELGGNDSVYLASPDLDKTTKSQLSNPTTGQFWYNSTRSMVYFYDVSRIPVGEEDTHPGWHPIPLRDNYAANWGMMAHGGQLPRPVSSLTGYTFDYDECIWSVSPADTQEIGRIDFMACGTDPDAVVNMQFRRRGDVGPVNGWVNYLIIGVKGNSNIGIIPSPSPTPTPTPSQTGGPTPTRTRTPTSTPALPSPTRTPVPSATPTRAASPTPAPTASPTRAVTPTRTRTPAGTPPVTPTRTRTMTVTPTRTRTPSPTRTRTPTATPPIIVTFACGGASAQAPAGGAASAGLVYSANGTCSSQSSQTGSTFGAWLTNGNASDYEIRAVETHRVVIGPSYSTTSGPLNTWVNMGSGVSWFANVSPPNAGASGTIEWTLSIQIRRASNQAVVASGQALFYVWSGTPI